MSSYSYSTSNYLEYYVDNFSELIMNFVLHISSDCMVNY